MVRQAGVDSDKDLLLRLGAPLSFLSAFGRLPMPLGYRGESPGGGGQKLFLRRENCGQDAGQVRRWQKRERDSVLFIKGRESSTSILVSSL